MIYKDLFLKHKKVTLKHLRNYLLSNGFIEKEYEHETLITGIDEKIQGTLSSRIDFGRLLNEGKLSEQDVERIIE